MLYDVLAIQKEYGENSNYAAGNDVYDIPGYWKGRTDLLDLLWDTGGHDTIDASASPTTSKIDLREGTYSDIGVIRNNIAISFGTIIEDAIGGSNNDILLGNQAVNYLKGNAGHDTIRSGASNDIMQGDAGNDTYEWSFGDGSDLIDEAGGAGRDRILLADIPRLDSLSEDFRFSLSGNDLLIDLRFDGSTEAILRVKNQMQGSSRIETLEFDGIRVDLVSLSSQITAPEQRFEITANSSAFGFLVAPVV
jgi:Ca2+-binding RTX toxin-like protein